MVEKKTTKKGRRKSHCDNSKSAHFLKKARQYFSKYHHELWIRKERPHHKMAFNFLLSCAPCPLLSHSVAYRDGRLGIFAELFEEVYQVGLDVWSVGVWELDAPQLRVVFHDVLLQACGPNRTWKSNCERSNLRSRNTKTRCAHT